ncbi:MAG: hypothetical protein ABI551_12885 [Polyangiaceae bacterium]
MKHTTLFRRLRFASSIALCPLFVVACGGDAPPPAAAPPATAAKAAPAAADTSAVPEPSDLVVTARVTKPSQVENVVGGWTSLPMPGADDIAELIADINVGSIIDLDAPIDVAVAVEGHAKRMKPVYAFAVGVKNGANPQSLERVKTTSLGGGVFKLEAKRQHAAANGDDEDADDAGTLCEIMPSAGPSTNRLICGGSEGAVAQLGPYLARTAPRTTYPTDLHVEARLDPLRQTLQQARQLIPMLIGSMSDEMKNQAVSELANAAIGDFVDAALDLDRVKIDVSLKDPAATATMTASFRETKSLIAQVAVAHPERADAPPALFWHLPADSKSAVFGRGIDANKLDHPRELIVNALTKVLDEKGVAPDDRTAIADVVQQYLTLFTVPSVFASGYDAPPASAAAPGKDKKVVAGSSDHLAKAEYQAKGVWSLMGLDTPLAKVVAFAKGVPTTMHRAGVQKLLKSSMAEGVPAPTFVSSPINAKLGLPKGSEHVVVTVTMKAPDQPEPEATPTDVKSGKATKAVKAAAKPKVKLEKPYVVHFLFVPDDGRTWIGYGADESIVASHIKTALSTGTDPGVLKSRAGLDDLKTAKVVSGGFITLRGALSPSPLQPLFHQNEDRDVARLFGRLPSTPQKGETPIPFMITSAPPAGQGAGSVNVTVKVPRDTVKDLVSAALGRP